MTTRRPTFEISGCAAVRLDRRVRALPTIDGETLKSLAGTLAAPFPYFGGKSLACETVWAALGDPEAIAAYDEKSSSFSEHHNPNEAPNSQQPRWRRFAFNSKTRATFAEFKGPVRYLMEENHLDDSRRLERKAAVSTKVLTTATAYLEPLFALLTTL